jgi:hypothetical protein
LEAYTAEHPQVTIEELLYDWPASKFESFYTAYAKRKIADELTLRRSLEMAAMWGNMNYDQQDDQELRQNLQGALEKGFSKAIAKLYGEEFPEDEEAEIDPDDPWFKAMHEGMKRRGIAEEE